MVSSSWALQDQDKRTTALPNSPVLTKVFWLLISSGFFYYYYLEWREMNGILQIKTQEPERFTNTSTFSKQRSNHVSLNGLWDFCCHASRTDSEPAALLACLEVNSSRQQRHDYAPTLIQRASLITWPSSLRSIYHIRDCYLSPASRCSKVFTLRKLEKFHFSPKNKPTRNYSQTNSAVTGGGKSSARSQDTSPATQDSSAADAGDFVEVLLIFSRWMNVSSCC